MRYYGNKTKLTDFISNSVKDLDISDKKTFFDIFTGTTSVAKHFKKLGYTIIANDFLYFSYVLAEASIAINSVPQFKGLRPILKHNNPVEVISYLNDLSGHTSFITKNYSPYKGSPRQYFSIENAERIDSIREQISNWKKSNLITDSESCYLVSSLLIAINLVSNVSGTYGSYLKNWDKRAFKKLELLAPDILPSDRNNIALNSNALEIVDKYKVDILYLDPPYNSRQYASNYFLLELIAEGWETKPNIYGYTGMRPYESQKSTFNTKSGAAKSLEYIVNKAKAKYIVLSYNNEGLITPEQIKQILSSRGEVSIKQFSHKRYRSIGQDGSNSRTTEYLYILKVGK